MHKHTVWSRTRAVAPGLQTVLELLIAARRAVVPGHFRSERHRMGLEPVQARVRNARKRHSCHCRPGWEPKARPWVRSSTHSSQRLVSATCQPLQLSRSSAERTSVRERGPLDTTTRVQPGATTSPRRRPLRSRPRGCRRPRALRWQPSARVQGPEPRGANGTRRESAVPEPCFRRRRSVVAARAIRR
jgi:hypothetical protein